MKLHLLPLVIATVLACAGVHRVFGQNEEDCKTMMTTDFSTYTAAAGLIPANSSDLRSKASIGFQFGIHDPAGALGHEPSLAEQKILGVMLLSNGNFHTVASTLRRASNQLLTTGSLPANGLALYQDAEQIQGVQYIENLSDDERYLACCQGINPVTGRFYESFQSREWTPGGIFIERMPDDFLLSRFPNYISEDGTNAPVMFHYIIYGAQQGSVLLDDYEIANGKPDPAYEQAIIDAAEANPDMPMMPK